MKNTIKRRIGYKKLNDSAQNEGKSPKILSCQQNAPQSCACAPDQFRPQEIRSVPLVLYFSLHNSFHIQCGRFFLTSLYLGKTPRGSLPVLSIHVILSLTTLAIRTTVVPIRILICTTGITNALLLISF